MSTVRIYHGDELVATHIRKYSYGYTNQPEHLAEKNRAQMRKSSAGDTMLLNKGIYIVRTLNSNGRISINKVVVI